MAYTPEFRMEAVRFFRVGGAWHQGHGYQTSIAPDSLRKWIAQTEIDDGLAEGLTSEGHVELRRLRREVKILEEEKEILRKAALFSPGRPITADEVPADR